MSENIQRAFGISPGMHACNCVGAAPGERLCPCIKNQQARQHAEWERQRLDSIPALAPDDELEDTIRRIYDAAEPFPAYQSRSDDCGGRTYRSPPAPGLPFTLPAEPAPTDRDLRLFGLGVLMGLCWAGLAYLVFA